MSAVAPAEGHGASAKPLAITGVLVLVVMSMVIPIPAAVLDLGIALSIASSVTSPNSAMKWLMNRRALVFLIRESGMSLSLLSGRVGSASPGWRRAGPAMVRLRA